MRFKFVCEYDGREFSGWQEQSNCRTIQGEIMNALENLFNMKIVAFGSGRTDAGVSAKNQVGHFDVITNLRPYNIMMALNRRLPETIRIKSIEQVDENFHCRYNTKKKTYSYHMYASSVESPLRRFTHLQVWPNLDFKSMNEACKYFEGTHDFKGFCQDNPQIVSTIRTIYSCKMTKVDDDITITICGDGFLHNMVRIICGTILKVGQRKIRLDDIESIIDSGDRRRAGQTLSAIGLVLESVEY